MTPVRRELPKPRPVGHCVIAGPYSSRQPGADCGATVEQWPDQEAAQRLILAGLVEHWGTLDPTKNPDLDDIQRSYVSRGHTFLVACQGQQLVPNP